MREDENFTDLSDLFAAEDRKLDGAHFVDGVMRQVQRRSVVRKLVLTVVGTLGALLALVQLPALLADTIVADGALTQIVTQARTDITSFAATDPLWMIVGAGVIFCLCAVAAMERA